MSDAILAVCEPVDEILPVQTELSHDPLETETGEQVVKIPTRLPRKGGNRRRGPLRAGNSKHPGKNTPASEDPIVLKRREIAMPLWNKGWTAGEIRNEVNAWLESEENDPVSAETIRRDKLAIFAEWERDFDQSFVQARVQHVASLQRMKAEAWSSYQTLIGKSNTAAAQFLKLAIDAESQIAKLDGTERRADIAAQQEAERQGARGMTRVYLGVNVEDLLPGQRAKQVVIEGEASPVLALPPPEDAGA